MSGFVWFCAAGVFAMMAAVAVVPGYFVRRHIRSWRRVGVKPEGADAFTIAMYRIVGILGMLFVTALLIAQLLGAFSPAAAAS